ncbi:MAG: glutamine synthetase family protein [Candidatus Obscuribacterales bacterium]|nr:glutamine synthetase family protein [Candidatus Obscuribacterales bacterium]
MVGLGKSPQLDATLERAKAADIQLVRFLYCDLSSMIRGKSANITRFADKASSGIGLVKGQLSMNMLDEPQAETGLGATGEVRLLADLSTFTVLPYTERQAQVLCNLVELNHSPWDLCPRAVLRRQIEKAAHLGISVQAAFEPEFSLGRMLEGQYVPIDRSVCFSTDGMNRAAEFISRFVDNLESQGLPVEQYYPELGHGQHELSIRHSSAMTAADRQITYRETLRGTAFQLGFDASLAPKPFENQAGNGCHLHLSLWNPDGTQNLLAANGQLSEIGQSFVAGILEHLPGIVALSCPSVNSYRRLKPRSWSSAYTCWGYENREAAVRIPTTYWGHEEESTNIEIKCVDSSANPYLALAAIIGAGLSGIEQKLTPPKPIEVEPSTLSDEQLKANKIRRLPDSLKNALAELKADTLLESIVGPFLLRTFSIVKESEIIMFGGKDIEFELSQHRFKY